MAQHPAPKVFPEIDGDPIYTVLEPDAIPAIRAPSFVTGKKPLHEIRICRHLGHGVQWSAPGDPPANL